jgi:hypothetical protein
MSSLSISCRAGARHSIVYPLPIEPTVHDAVVMHIPSVVHRSDQATSFRLSISTVRAAPASPFVSSCLAGLVMFIAGEDLCMPVPNLSCLVRTTCFQELHVPYLVQASGAKHACLCAWTQARLIVSVYATCSYRSHAITMSNFALAK